MMQAGGWMAPSLSLVENKRPWISSGVSESLLDLATKLRNTEKRIIGKASHSTPQNLAPGVCSCVDRGKLRFIFRNQKKANQQANSVRSTKGSLFREECQSTLMQAASRSTPLAATQDLPISLRTEINKQNPLLRTRVESDSVQSEEAGVEAVRTSQVGHARHENSDNGATDDQSEKLINVSECDNHVGSLNDVFDAVAMTERFSSSGIAEYQPLVLKKLTVLDRPGPSLWPFLSSVKTSVDADHVKFLDRNNDHLSSYNDMDVLIDYMRPLSADDMETILDNAIEVTLHARKARFLHRLSNGWNSVNSSPPKNGKVSLNSTEIDAVQAESNCSQMNDTQNGQVIVSKRYAAAIANPRRFKCNLCPYSTNNRSHVRRHHISVHSDARPFRCYVCGKEFARSENAKVHILSRHVGVIYDPEKIKSKHYQMLTGDSALASYDSETPLALSPVAVNGSEGEAIVKIEPTDCDLPEKKPRFEDKNVAVSSSANANGLLFSSVLSLLANGTNGNLSSADASTINRWAQECRPCPHCRYLCRDAGDLLRHLATSHGEANVGLSLNTLAAAAFGAPAFPQLRALATTPSMNVIVKDGGHNLNAMTPLGALSSPMNHITTFPRCPPLLNPISAFGPRPPHLNSVTPVFAGGQQLNAANLTPAFRYVFLNNVQQQQACPMPGSSQSSIPLPGSTLSGGSLPVSVANDLLAEASKSAISANPHFRPILPKAESNLGVPAPVTKTIVLALQPPISSSSTQNHVTVVKPQIQVSQPQPLKTETPTTTPSGASHPTPRPPRSFKTFFCDRCPDRAPFRYRKSFDKHLAQHRVTDGIVGGPMPVMNTGRVSAHNSLDNGANGSALVEMYDTSGSDEDDDNMIG